MFGHAWLAGGIPRTACVAAYEPICAVSLADSYINRANPGTLDAYAGAAPTWSAELGWTFGVGAGKYLLADIVAGADTSLLIRFSNATNSATDKIIAGSQSSGAYRFFIEPSNSNQVAYTHGGYTFVAPGLLSGVLGVSGQQGYRDGAADGSTFAATGTGTYSKIAIGALNDNGSVIYYCNCNIQALYIYNVPITPTQVRAVTDAMNMLPMRPGIRDGVMGKFGASKNAVRISPSRGGLL